MNILIVNEIDWIRKVVVDAHWIAESMALLGHQVYVVDYESLWGDDRSKRREKELLVSRAFPNAKVHLIHTKFMRVPVMSRLTAFLNSHFEIKRVIEKADIDAIVLYSVPTNGLQTVRLAKKFKIPIVFRSIDVLNQLVPYPILRAVTKWLEKRVYRRVDRILTITPNLSDYVIRMGAKEGKVGLLPIPVDTGLFQPSDGDKELRKMWGLSGDDKVILYMGTLFNFSGLDRFICMFLRHILQYEWKAKLLVVGDGEQRRDLELLAQVYGIENRVIFTGFQPYMDIPRYINIADVCVNPFIINDTTKDIFPGKTVQFLACGKPVVMRPLEGTKAVISGEMQGVVYACDDDKICEEVVALLGAEQRRRTIGRNGLKYVREHHSHEKVAKQLETELTEMIRGKASI